MIVAVPVSAAGAIDPRWGRADRLAIADLRGEQVVTWRELDVGWGQLHDQGTEGSHHARIARILLENGVQLVVAGHMGGPMVHMLGKLGVRVRLGASGDPRVAVLSAIAGEEAPGDPPSGGG